MNPVISNDIDMPSPQPELELDEKQDVATITTDEVQPMDEDQPSADDHQAMKKKFLPADPDLETLDEQMTEWKIEGYRGLEQKVHSPTFKSGGTPWRLLMFPFGNNNASDWCSCYLEHSFDEKPSEDWYTCIQFLIVAYNPHDPSIYTLNTAQHRYNSEATDWGFNKFFDIRRAAHGWYEQGARPLLEGDALNFDIYVRTVKDPTGVLWHSFENYDSKKETGMIGIKNQGATCYLNSLLQSLYLTNAFRKAIYQIPTEDETNPRANSAYALQRLFYILQNHDKAASTDELTAAFGWDTRQTFVQQDVQELARLLMDNMEEKLKGTPHEKDLSNLFVGSTQTFLHCINVSYESSSSQVFWDLQLNVRGQNTLDESFRNNLQVERMEGENAYFAEGFGLQTTEKGDIYESFPPVLHLQLKRFEFNWEYNVPTKINDRMEFPEQFDASPYLHEKTDRSEPWVYNLHGVLVHSGDLDAGHYYAFLKPNKDGDFYRFDDDRVTRATKKEAIDENFGGEFANKGNGANGMQKNPFTFKYTKHRFMSAYMLVYIRETRLDEVLHPIPFTDIPAHLDAKIKEEQIEFERRKKERDEAHLYMQLVVGTTQNYNSYQGFDVFPAPNADGVEKAALPKIHRVLRNMKIAEFKTMVATELGLEADLIRPWACVGRQNHTVRPDTPMDWSDTTLEEASQKINGKVPFRIWLETTGRRPDGEPDWVDADLIMQIKNPAQPILLFLKYFDIEKQTLLGQGCIYIEKSRKVTELGQMILEKMGWPAGTNMKLFEEIKADMIEPLKPANTFQQSELQSGDIICVQKILPEAEANQLSQDGLYTDARQYYEYLINRVKVTFYDKNDLDAEDRTFNLELSRRMSYDLVAERLANQLNVDPTHLRFSAVMTTTGRPRQPARRTANTTLASMTSSQVGIYGSTSGAVRPDVMMYEVLDISLSEMETKKQMKLTFVSEGITKEDIFDVLVPRNGSVRDFVAPLKARANISDEDEQRLRFYQVHGSKIFKDLDDSHAVAAFNEFVTIHSELAPKEEDEADMSVDRAVYCFHFEKEPGKVHSVPFSFVVKPGELFKDTKERLSTRTGIKGKNFERMKFAICRRLNLQKPEYLNDDDVLFDKLTGADDQLGLDHMNKTRTVRQGDKMMIR